MNTVQATVVSGPRRPTIQYFVRGLVALAHRRGHSLPTLLTAVTQEYNDTQK